jgi:diguanylate cyclase (GGDEF)-like protein
MCEQTVLGQPARHDDLEQYEQSQSAMLRWLNAMRQKVADIATQHDVLTGLPLRHGLDYAFSMRQKDGRRMRYQLWLAMIDLDRFKTINDTHGHPVGDLALQHAAKRISAGLRESDLLVRFGGEEFLALLLVANEHDAQSVAHRVLQSLRDNTLRLASGLELQVTATIGLVQVTDEMALAQAVERADHALLEGKLHSRDCLVMA